jgi:hypothetical protein
MRTRLNRAATQLRAANPIGLIFLTASACLIVGVMVRYVALPAIEADLTFLGHLFGRLF